MLVWVTITLSGCSPQALRAQRHDGKGTVEKASEEAASSLLTLLRFVLSDRCQSLLQIKSVMINSKMNE